MTEPRPTYDTIDTKEIVSWLTDRVGTHFDGCWQYHPECLIVRLCNEIDELRQERTALSLKLDECYKRIEKLQIYLDIEQKVNINLQNTILNLEDRLKELQP